MASIVDRARRAWEVFRGRDPTEYKNNYGPGYSRRPDKSFVSFGGERSIVNAVYNRIAIDVAEVDIEHVKKNDDGFFKESIKSDLNNCLTISANLDQTGRNLIKDIVLSMFDEGVIAVVPTYVESGCSLFHDDVASSKIYEMRTAKIKQWYPKHVRVELYNDDTGQKKEITVPKKNVAIIENPFYVVMNEPNSIGRRLINKLNLLDVIDEQLGAGKLDLIIQLPYVVKTPLKKQQAEARRKDLEDQLNNSKYGVAYADGTEKIIQLNRPLENNLMSQIEYLTTLFYSELGICEEILKGTADEKMQLNYRNNVIEPVLTAITEEMSRKWLTPTAVSQGQRIFFIQNPFKLIPIANIAEIADKFTRATVLSPNEVRSIIGYKPVDDERANELRNPNLNASDVEMENPINTGEEPVENSQSQEIPEDIPQEETQGLEEPVDDHMDSDVTDEYYQDLVRKIKKNVTK